MIICLVTQMRYQRETEFSNALVPPWPLISSNFICFVTISRPGAVLLTPWPDPYILPPYADGIFLHLTLLPITWNSHVAHICPSCVLEFMLSLQDFVSYCPLATATVSSLKPNYINILHQSSLSLFLLLSVYIPSTFPNISDGRWAITQIRSSSSSSSRWVQCQPV